MRLLLEVYRHDYVSAPTRYGINRLLFLVGTGVTNVPQRTSASRKLGVAMDRKIPNR
jgi:hypothetical protein